MQKLSLQSDPGVVNQDVAALMLLCDDSSQFVNGRRIRQIAGKSRSNTTNLDDPIADSIQLPGATGDENHVRSHCRQTSRNGFAGATIGARHHGYLRLKCFHHVLSIWPQPDRLPNYCHNARAPKRVPGGCPFSL
jgi:hypothetical protein